MSRSLFEIVPIFESGSNVYAIYRIPGIVATANGVLLAYCEARRTPGGDWGAIDLFMRRSTDGGKTWSAPQQMNCLGEYIPKNPVALNLGVATANEQTYNNPLAISDDEPGVVHFLHCAEYARSFYRRSEDDGLTWSEPVDITSAVEELRALYGWRVVAIGPGHGIQLSTGRLLAPVWLSDGSGGHGHRPSVAATIYSDDSGGTWHAGEIFAADGAELANPSEATLVELADGRVMVNLRTESLFNRRVVATSPDGIQGWGKPSPDQVLFEPVCSASLQRLSRQPLHRQNRLLFSNPDSQFTGGPDQLWGAWKRVNLTVRMSYDEGNTWPVAKVIDPGMAGYSDLATDSHGTIFCAYEGGGVNDNYFANTHLSVARFNLTWLTDGKDTDL